jgi:HPr kinase/phosphorylase
MELTGVTSQSIFDDNAADIKLSWVAGLEGADRAFDVEFAREATSAADLVGHLNLIHPNRIQVLGKPEILYYQRLDDEPRKRQMGELILLEPPFLVVADGMEPPPDLELRCTRSSTPLFTTPVSSAAVIDHLRLYLSRISAPRVTMHGVFLDILGMGVLIMGESGRQERTGPGTDLARPRPGGRRRRRFRAAGPDFIEGRCPPLLQNLLEVRGLGLLDIKTIFGETAVRRR